MEKENKKTMYFVLSGLITLILASAVFLVGSLLNTNLTDTEKTAFLIASAVLTAIQILLFLGNLLAAKIYSKRITKLKSKQIQADLALRKENAKNNITNVINKVQKIRLGMYLYAVLFLLLILSTILFSTLSQQFYFYFLPVVAAYFVIYRLIPQKKEFDFSDYSDPNEYPEIHTFAKNTAQAMNLDGDVRICFTQEDCAGIARFGNTFSLRLGVLFLSVLSEQEFEQILIHEFGHFTVDDLRMTGAARLYERIMSSPKKEILFGFFDSIFTYEYSMYVHSASVTLEEQADNAVVKYGKPNIAASALVKASFLELFDNENMSILPEPYFAPEEKRKDTTLILSKLFRNAIAERGAFWESILKNEIQPRNASHPILKYRIKNIGADDFEVSLPKDDSEFSKECAKAIEQLDKIIYEDELDKYSEERKYHYLEPLRVINEWKENGEPLTAEQTREVITSFLSLLQVSKAEALCDRIIREEKNQYAKAYAYFIKGRILLERYDKNGIELMYKALELNDNYAEAVFEDIGSFCCLMGLQKELDEYREKVGNYRDNMYRLRQQTGVLSNSDRLSENDMPADMLDGILKYIDSIHEGNIEQVFTVKKTITNDFFVYPFVIKFFSEATNENINKTMHLIFEHLDTHPSGLHFSLFVLDKETEAAVKKVKNSCAKKYK